MQNFPGCTFDVEYAVEDLRGVREVQMYPPLAASNVF